MAEYLRSPSRIPKFISFLASLLQRVAESNDNPGRQFQAQTMSIFHGLTRPAIPIRSYLERIFRYADCSPCCYAVAYVYLDRFARRRPELPIDSFSIHRFIITSVMVAAKFMNRMCYKNEYFAMVGGVSIPEMNLLEMVFLFGVDFRLNVTPSAFLSCSNLIQREMLLLEPPLISLTPPLHAETSMPMSHCYFSEDDSPPHHHQQQQKHLAAV